jgi:16S rRNA (guanine966-N2)-methyltransferase
MRIISGEAKGRPLYAPSGVQTRPTSDKIRGALFNIIGARVMDSRVLDLFGGSGALALEALSRGQRAPSSRTIRARPGRPSTAMPAMC